MRFYFMLVLLGIFSISDRLQYPSATLGERLVSDLIAIMISAALGSFASYSLGELIKEKIRQVLQEEQDKAKKKTDLEENNTLEGPVCHLGGSEPIP